MDGQMDADAAGNILCPDMRLTDKTQKMQLRELTQVL